MTRIRTLMKLGSVLLALAVVAIPSQMFANPIPIGGGGVLNLGSFSVAAQQACVIFYNGTINCGGTATANINDPTDPIFGDITGTGQDTLKSLGATPPISQVLIDHSNLSGNFYSFDLLGFFIPASTPFCTVSTPQGTNCQVAGSPFVFDQTSPTTVAVQLNENLCGYTGNVAGGGGTLGTCPTGTPYTGLLTGNIAGQGNLQTILNTIATGGTVTGGSISYALNPSAVPEPVSMLLIGSGLLGVALVGRRLRRS